MNSKKLILPLAVVLLAGVTTSCGNQPPIEPVIPNVISLEKLKAKYTASSPIEIDFWHNFGSNMTSYVQTAIDAFEEKYDFIKVKHEGKGGYDGVKSAITKSINSSSYPNVAVGYPDHFAEYISAQIQYVLDDYIKSSDVGVDINDYHANYMAENQRLLYADEEKSKAYTVGIPYNKSTEAMIYNKTFFDAFELTVPSTWAEVETTGKAIIKTLTDGNYFGKLNNIEYGDGKTFALDLQGVTKEDFYPMSWDSQANFFITTAYQFGGEYTEMGASVEEGFVKFNNPQVIEGLTYVKKLNTDHVLGIPATWDETSYCSNPFKAMKSVMTVSSTAGVANNIPSGDKFEIGIAPIPYKTADKKFVISQGANLAIFKGNDYESLAAWLLVRYLSGGEYTENENANVDFCISSGYLPVTKSGESSAWYQQYINSQTISAADRAKIAVQKIANEYYVNDNWTKFVDPAFIGSSEIRTQVDLVIPFITTGASGKIYTPQEAIDYAYSKLQQYVK